jgi:hypothetical protein
VPPVWATAATLAGERHAVDAAWLRARRHGDASSWYGPDLVPLVAPERETSMYTTGYTHLDQCDTRPHEGSGSKNGPGIVFDPVAIRRVRRALVTEACEAAGEVQGEPEPGLLPDLAAMPGTEGLKERLLRLGGSLTLQESQRKRGAYPPDHADPRA